MRSLSKHFLRVSLAFLITILLVLFFLPKSEQAKQAEANLGDPFYNINLKAKSALVIDLSNNSVIYAKNKDDILPIASLTKIMTVLTAAELVPLDTVITIEGADASSTSHDGLYNGERWHLSNLIHLTLVSSSNVGAESIAKTIQTKTHENFPIAMNAIADQLGLVNTRFRNATGLDLNNNTISGSYSTAGDIAELFKYVYQNKPEVLAYTNQGQYIGYSLTGNRHVVYNTNELVGKIPGLLASKTGTTAMAGGNLAIIYNPVPNHPVISIVLGSSPAGRFSDMTQLIKATQAKLKNS